MHPLQVSFQAGNDGTEQDATTALSTSLSNILSSIFTNLNAIPWNILSALRSVVAFKIAKGSDILGDVSKGVGVTINSAADVFDIAKSGTKSVGQGFNNFGDYVKTAGSSVASVIEEKKGNQETPPPKKE